MSDVTFKKEVMSDIIDELTPLFEEHYNEVGAFGGLKVGLNVHLGAYKSYEDHKILHFVTARSGKELVGYCVFIIAPHLHFVGTLVAANDTIFIRKKYRKGLTGSRLIKYAGESLRGQCEIVLLDLPVGEGYIKLAKRSGFKLIGHTFRLEDV